MVVRPCALEMVFAGDPISLARDNTVCESCRLQIHSGCQATRRIGGALPANPSFGMTMKKISQGTVLWQTPQFTDIKPFKMYSWIFCVSVITHEKLHSYSTLSLEINVHQKAAIYVKIKLLDNNSHD